MYFIAVLITFGLLQYWGSFSAFHKDGWFFGLLETAQAMMRSSWLIYTASVLFPCLLLVALLALVHDRAYGLLSLLLAVVILIYAHGRVEYNSIIKDYMQAWQCGELERLPAIIQKLDESASTGFGEGLQRDHVNAREAYAYAAFQGLFAVLFWFVLLGPAGALLYRLNCFFVSKSDWRIARNVQAILEWPAAALLSLTFALVGDFDKALPSWRSTVFNKGMTNRNVVHANALAASNLNMDWLRMEFVARYALEQQAVLVVAEMESLMHLVKRSLIFAVFVIAVFQIVI